MLPVVLETEPTRVNFVHLSTEIYAYIDDWVSTDFRGRERNVRLDLIDLLAVVLGPLAYSAATLGPLASLSLSLSLTLSLFLLFSIILSLLLSRLSLSSSIYQ